MTAEEIARVVRQFTEAARRAQKAGFDGVQIHAAHFFFLSRFISPAVNHRTDAYGGSTVHPLRSISSHEPNQRFECSLKNRARILLDILSGIREATPDLHVTIKINCNDFTASGLDEKACLDICQILDKAGIARYCQRLARIYKNEESIGGLPINMENFCLFDENHRSSKPLNLAYEAAKPADHQKADAFLKALRHATVKAGLPTTHFDVILDVARHSGIDETAFTKHYEDGSADLAYAKLLRVHSLPTYLFQYQGKALFLQSFDYHEFVEAISRLTA
ncbi:MAG: DsbA family protein [Eubacteriaceae bacterium]|nr:DsbA family protein [Eubacteriaceae bacterium]